MTLLIQNRDCFRVMPTASQTDDISYWFIGGKEGAIFGDAAFVLETGSVAVDWLQILSAGSTYVLYFYIDENDDGYCNDAPAWRVSIPAVDHDVDQSETYSSEYSTEVCSAVP